MGSVFRFDTVRIAPTDADLHSLLVDAAQAANKGARVRKFAWTEAMTENLLSRVRENAEGFRQWTGLGEVKRKTSGSDTCSAVAVVWWTDPIGRIHYRIASERVFVAYSEVNNLLNPRSKRPPLWLIHWEHVYFRDSRDGPPWMICRCGAVGDAGTLGWMGATCAACHDRAEEGTLPVGDGQPATTVLRGHTSWVGQVRFTPEGNSVVAGCRSHADRILRWNLATGIREELVPVIVPRHRFAFAPTGDWLALSRHRAQFTLVPWPEGTPERTITCPDSSRVVFDLAFSPNGHYLAVALAGSVLLYDVAGGGQMTVVASGLHARSPSRYLAFSSDGQTLAVGYGHSRGLLLWDIASRQGRTLEIEGVLYGCDSVAFAPDGQTLAVVNNTPGHVRLVDVAKGHELIHPEFRRASDAAISPDGKILAVVGYDASLRLFAIPRGQPLGVFFWHTANVNEVAFSPDGRWIATSSDDGYVKLWPVAGLLASAS